MATGSGSVAEWCGFAATVFLGGVTAWLACTANTIAEDQAEIAERQSESAYFDTVQTCAVYRDQVLLLHKEYGLAEQDIRDLLEREKDFVAKDEKGEVVLGPDGKPEGVESGCGRINFLLEVAKAKPTPTATPTG